MIYVRRNEGSVLPQPTSSTFLPFVLSDSHTVLGPQWTNHTATVDCSVCPWLSTDYGATSDLAMYNMFDVFLYSKTASNTDSPGYMILDYVMQFREISISPRVGSWSTWAGANAQWQPAVLSYSANTTAGSTTYGFTFGTAWAGGKSVTALTLTSFNIWEFVVDVSNSSLGAATNANLFSETSGTSNQITVQVNDGAILYLCGSSSTLEAHATKDDAFSRTNSLKAGVTATPLTLSLVGFARCVANISLAVGITYSQ